MRKLVRFLGIAAVSLVAFASTSSFAIGRADFKDSTAALAAMAKSSGTDLAGFRSQLSTAALFYTPKATLDFV
jgi:hypothetical protein